MRNRKRPQDGRDPREGQRPKPPPLRWNLLMLMFLAYGSIFGFFMVLVWFGSDPKEAYNLISVPFVALVGGTLAIVKDLL